MIMVECLLLRVHSRALFGCAGRHSVMKCFCLLDCITICGSWHISGLVIRGNVSACNAVAELYNPLWLLAKQQSSGTCLLAATIFNSYRYSPVGAGL